MSKDDNVSQFPKKGSTNILDDLSSMIDGMPNTQDDENNCNINKINISGMGNVIGSNNIVHIQPPQQVKKKVIVKTGDGVINATQKAKLQGLIRDLKDTHSQVKKSELSWGAAWSKVIIPLKVSSYHEIPGERFEDAAKILQIEIAKLKNMNSAPKKVKNWRASQIKAIQARCNERGLQDWRKEYMVTHFGQSTMTKLTDKEIQILYRAVMGKR